MKWISVKNRLPEQDEPVLIWYQGAMLNGDAAVAFVIGSRWELFHTDSPPDEIKEPDYWMPLPEPPK